MEQPLATGMAVEHDDEGNTDTNSSPERTKKRRRPAADGPDADDAADAGTDNANAAAGAGATGDGDAATFAGGPYADAATGAAGVTAAAVAVINKKAPAAARQEASFRVGVGAGSLLTGAVLWLLVAPLLAAGLFHLTFVVSEESWTERGGGGDGGGCSTIPTLLFLLFPWRDQQPLLRTLALGAFLLHMWAYLCHQVGVPMWAIAALRAVGVLHPRAAAAAVAEDEGAGRRGEGGGGQGRPGLPPLPRARPLFWENRIEASAALLKLP